MVPKQIRWDFVKPIVLMQCSHKEITPFDQSSVIGVFSGWLFRLRWHCVALEFVVPFDVLRWFVFPTAMVCDVFYTVICGTQGWRTIWKLTSGCPCLLAPHEMPVATKALFSERYIHCRLLVPRLQLCNLSRQTRLTAGDSVQVVLSPR